ncbi:alanine acetyltransferase [Haematobacter missouriensis]|uniref:Ribosomal-protein-alanine acetyltransferase n=1 Tax=Haematobacter missouriensis TaxID=366616 RepID=A0A212AVM8_9RHOB|nr:GNAT family N-acetyltransferase [Haematobacter missouriensis]KFI33582.1 alanine acetyltransferase [Haematobacter missouriensis]OWJ79248.1 ribosomal-protein-alanine acetyltransferase [Haematobacter missouriensis]OWJ85521.1 ribosomal-protein-alanine acetyltransferase [Haematobacter missouriensis]
MTPAELAQLHAESFTTPRPWSEREMAEVLAGRGVFLLREDAAFLIGRVIADEAELLTLAVSSAFRQRGIGRRLVEGFAAEAARRGAASAFLEVAADNAPARALYAATGFRVAGHRRGYYATPDGGSVDAVVMTRALLPS